MLLSLAFLPFLQGKAMEDLEIQNILTDPGMRQVISHQMFNPLSKLNMVYFVETLDSTERAKKFNK
jgi:hypothetical protein